MNNRLKKIIFDKLYKDLSHVEIISYQDSIWFIDRENKYWYFEYVKTGVLWWRHTFFTEFFSLFSMERDEFQSVLSEWVEEVLNYKVNKTGGNTYQRWNRVEVVLNCKVNTTCDTAFPDIHWVEVVLNCKVNTTYVCLPYADLEVEEVLKCKVNTTNEFEPKDETRVEEVLKFVSK